MEKRFVTFAVLSILVLLAFQALDTRLNPPPEPDPNAVPEQLVDKDQPGAGGDAPELVNEPVETNSAAEVDSATPFVDVGNAPVTPTEVSEQRMNSQPTWATLGTLASDGPDRMLVWFTSRGAAIESIALNNPRYGDLERRYGYLGFLSPQDDVNGCRINVVGPGTPAANATSPGQSDGLAPGDVITSANGRAIPSLEDFQAWLTTTHPGDSVEITVLRDGQPLTFQTELRSQPLQVIRPEFTQSETVNRDHPLSYRLGLTRLGSKKTGLEQNEIPGLPSLKNEHWKLAPSDDPRVVEFHYRLSAAELQSFDVQGPLLVVKRFQLMRPDATGTEENPYHLNYEIEFINEGPAGEVTLAYTQDGPTGLPIEGWWYTYKTHPTSWGAAGVRDVVTRAFDGNYKMLTNPKMVKRLEENPTTPAFSMFDDINNPMIRFAGVDAQYFASALVANVRPTDLSEGEPSPFTGDRTPADYTFMDAKAVPIGPEDPVKPSRTDVTFRLDSLPVSIAPGASYRQQFVIFAGPKQPELLAKYGLSEMITYGWFPLVAKPLIWVLHFFNGIFHNYGIAIILLTVMVRSCLFPIGRQQALNAQKMQELAPEMRKIAEKYKNDMEKRSAAQRELFQKNNYNPLAGCLPMFLQLPIFIGLYRALSIDIELRQAPLIPGIRWCSNLAGPDMLWNWESFMPEFLAGRNGWLGPYLNVLPLITVGLMIVQQKLFTPPPTDEQQEMQQRMMKFMMLFFALMFFRVPAGLCIYFITSSLWGIAERKLLPKRAAEKEAAAKKEEPTKDYVTRSKQSSNGADGAKKRRAKSKRR